MLVDIFNKNLPLLKISNDTYCFTLNFNVTAK